LVETLLDVYRNNLEGLRLNLELIDLNELAELTITTLIELAQSRRIHISLNYGESNYRRSTWVYGDALQLQRVFINLLSNAINHSPRGGKVEVIIESSSEDHIIKVTDNGSGITPEESQHLFERFYQGNSNRHAKGSGLGLYLSRQIVNAHQGKIWAENRPNGGAVFSFQLPVYYPNNCL
jgi:two-component system NarL family sensor kinase